RHRDRGQRHGGAGGPEGGVVREVRVAAAATAEREAPLRAGAVHGEAGDARARRERGDRRPGRWRSGVQAGAAGLSAGLLTWILHLDVLVHGADLHVHGCRPRTTCTSTCTAGAADNLSAARGRAGRGCTTAVDVHVHTSTTTCRCTFHAGTGWVR